MERSEQVEMAEPKTEEMLECIWTAVEESGNIKIEKINERFGTKSAHKLLQKMVFDGFVKFDNNKVDLTDAGKKQAELVIRRHRLAERLLHDVLDMPSDQYEAGACQFEHFIGEDIVASICTLLGHPDRCPHGKVIPKGECCSKPQKDIKSLIVPLSRMEIGDYGKVVYITTKFHNRLDRVSDIGILPGVQIKLHQKFPSFVIQVGESQIALDNNIAQDIFVRRNQMKQ